MWHRTILPNLVVGSLAVCLLALPDVRSETTLVDGTLETPGVEVQTRGPLHEAFAQPMDGEPQPGVVVPKEPPALIDEQPPDQKPQGENVQWVPGYWQWDDDKGSFLWISGFWRQPPPGRRWIPGHFDRTGGGYQWVAGYWAPAEQREVEYLPPPPASVEAGPSTLPPSDDSLYVPGSWVYGDSRYRWRPGFYMGYRPGWIWHPAQFLWTPAGFVFVDGYWDYALDSRGLLFAPVCIDPVVCARPGFVFHPCYVVRPSFLTTALFVRPGYRHYYMGDYFDARYNRAGFTAFVDYRFGRAGLRDPLFDYYRVAHHGQTWERDLRGQYDGRFRGDVARPPRTLVQQNTVVRNTPNVAVVAPLARTEAHGVTLARVSSQQVAATRQGVQNVREASAQRQRLEQAVVTRSGTPRSGDKPQTVRFSEPSLVAKTTSAPPPPTPVEKAPAVIHRDTMPKVTTPTPKVETPAPKVTTPIPVVKHDAPLVIKHDPPPRVIKHDPAPVIKRDPPPLVIKHDPPPPVIKRETPPPAPKVSSPPPPPKVSPPPPPKVSSPPPPPRAKSAPAPKAHSNPTPSRPAPAPAKPKPKK
jgi:hypothetical protein